MCTYYIILLFFIVKYISHIDCIVGRKIWTIKLFIAKTSRVVTREYITDNLPPWKRHLTHSSSYLQLPYIPTEQVTIMLKWHQWIRSDWKMTFNDHFGVILISFWNHNDLLFCLDFYLITIVIRKIKKLICYCIRF